MSKRFNFSSVKKVINLYFREEHFKDSLNLALKEVIAKHPVFKDVTIRNVLYTINLLNSKDHANFVLISAEANADRAYTLSLKVEGQKSEYIQFVKEVLCNTFEKMDVVVTAERNSETITFINGYHPGFKAVGINSTKSSSNNEGSVGNKEFKISDYAGESIKGVEENPLFNYKMGLYSLKTNSYEKAIKYFSNASKLNPTNAANFYQLGISYFNLGQIAESIKNFKKACAIDFNNNKFEEELSKFYYGKEPKQISDAVGNIIKMLDGKDAVFHNLVGDFNAKHGNYLAAIDCYGDSITHISEAKDFRAYDQIKTKLLSCIKKLDSDMQDHYLTKFFSLIIKTFTPLVNNLNPEISATAKKLIAEIRSEHINIQNKILFSEYLEIGTIEALNKILDSDPKNTFGLNAKVHLALVNLYKAEGNSEMTIKHYEGFARSSPVEGSAERVDKANGLLSHKRSLSINLPPAGEEGDISIMKSQIATPHVTPHVTPHASPRNSLSTSSTSSEDECLSAHATPRNSLTKVFFDEPVVPLSPFFLYRGGPITTPREGISSDKILNGSPNQPNPWSAVLNCEMNKFKAPHTPQSQTSKNKSPETTMLKPDFLALSTSGSNLCTQKSTSSMNTPRSKISEKSTFEEHGTLGGNLILDKLNHKSSYETSVSTSRSKAFDEYSKKSQHGTPMSTPHKGFVVNDNHSKSPFGTPLSTPRNKVSPDEDIYNLSMGSMSPLSQSRKGSMADEGYHISAHSTPMSTSRKIFGLDDGSTPLSTSRKIFGLDDGSTPMSTSRKIDDGYHLSAYGTPLSTSRSNTTKFSSVKNESDKYVGSKYHSLQVPTNQTPSTLGRKIIDKIIVSPPASPRSLPEDNREKELPHELDFELTGEGSLILHLTGQQGD